jgi:hypothetical protein
MVVADGDVFAEQQANAAAFEHIEVAPDEEHARLLIGHRLDDEEVRPP